MSDSGGRDERTVIKPMPGGRAPAPPSQARPAPAAAPGYNPGNAPAYQPAPQSFSPVAPGRPAGVSDDWIASSAQRGPAVANTMPRAENLQFDELAAQHENPIMRAAGPLLLLLGRLRVAMLRASLGSLMEQVAEAVNFFDKDIRKAGTETAQANTAKYLLCATADDIVQNIPTDDRHVWTQYSMLSRFFGERIGGVRFFDELDRLLKEPVVNYNVLELQHACLALGFQGVHRSSAGGAGTLQHIQRNLYETLRRVRPKTTRDYSPRWQGLAMAFKKTGWGVPVWVVAAATALALLGGYFALRNFLGDRAEAVAAEEIGLHPLTKITLQRRLPAPPPAPLAPTPVQVTQIHRVCDGFAAEIRAGAITCTTIGQFVLIRVGNLLLFDSGKADVLPKFKPVATRIAQVIDKEAGPIRIVGHTDNDSLGPTDRFKSNQELSVERAKGVAAIIKPLLADAARIGIEGRGPDEPVLDNKTSEHKAQNRRVEIMIPRAE